MKRSLQCFIIFISVVAVTACSSKQRERSKKVVNNPDNGLWQSMEQSPLQFTLKQTWGDNKKMMFPATWHLQGPVADENGNIYLIDDKSDVMYSFSPDGTLRWKKGQKGKGPGDFKRPVGLVINNDFLYTSNVRGTRIDKFSLQGNLIYSTPVGNFGMGTFTSVVGFISDSLLVTEKGMMGTMGDKITILNTTDTLRRAAQFNIIPKPELKFSKSLGMSVSISAVDSLIAAGNSGDYRINFFNKKGTKERTITRDFDKLVRFGHYHSGSNRGIGSFGALQAPINLQNGYYLVQLSWPTNVKNPDRFLEQEIQNKNAPEAIFKNAIDLYKSDGTLLYSWINDGRTPSIGQISYIASDGDIYTKSDSPYPQIRRYTIAIHSPKGK